MAFVYSLLALTWAAIVVLGLLIVGIIRQVNVLTAEINRRTSTEDSVLRTFEHVAPAVDDLSLSRGETNLLFFLSPNCDTCSAIVPAIAERVVDSRLRVIVVLADESAQSEFSKNLSDFPIVVSPTAYRVFNVKHTPSAVAVDSEGRLLATAAAVSSPSMVHQIFDLLINGEEARLGVPSS